MVNMMRIISVFFCWVFYFSTVVAQAAEPSGAEDVAKATFVKVTPLVKGAKRLLSSSADQLFFEVEGGAVAVTDFEGQQAFVLQAKEGSDSVLVKPEGVAIGGGMIYVADSDRNQVAMFTSGGKYVGRLGAASGGFFGGKGEHALKKPLGVATHEGIVYVLDGGAKRILMFGSDGVFLRVLDLKSSASDLADKSKADASKLNEPIALQVDVTGRLYVLEAREAKVKIFSAEGLYLNDLPAKGEPSSFVVAQDGIYVVQNKDFSIQKFSFDGKLMFTFGSKGDGRGQLKSLAGIALSKDRRVMVADVEKAVLNYFVADAGLPLEAIPRAASRVFVQSVGEIPVLVSRLVWNGKGTVYGIDADNEQVLVIREGKIQGQIKIKDVVPVSVAADVSGALWVLDKKYRVLKLDESGKILFSFGREGSAEGQFDDPTDMVISKSGKIYVADKGNDSVQIFNGEGKFLNAVRKLDNPYVLAVDERDTFFVLGKGNDFIGMYSAQGALIGSFGKAKDGVEGGLREPRAMAAAFGEVMVLDGNQVKVYSDKGDYLRSFGAAGKQKGEVDGMTAIALKDEVTFMLAEKGSKRIQSFVTQYKPNAPQHFVAASGLHSIALNWDALELPYVKQYQIYRSKAKSGGFVRVGVSTSNQFVDRGLEPEGKYFYCVAAETKLGYEGATSPVVEGLSKKYTPPAVEAVQVEPLVWKIKLKWKPIESEFLGSYLIYQKDKEGATFTKVAESILPEITMDDLTPNTKYTYYIAAHSTDGTDAEKVAVTATTLAFTKPPLEIEVLKLKPIFSNTYKLYEQDGIGRVRLTNNTNKVMEGVTLSFLLKDFMDYPTESKFEKLRAGESAEVTLKAVFNNNILNFTEDTSVQTLLNASYFDNGKRESFTKNSTVSVYEKHKLMWDERGRYASFVTPKDPPLMGFVRSVVTQYKEAKDEAQLAAILFNAVGVYGLTYVQDPTNPYQKSSGSVNLVDYIQFPRETLERKSGDCDDLVAFFTSAIESLGISTRVIEVPGHMFMMFSTGVHADEDRYTMDDMYVIYDDMLWIPVETTVVGSSFVKAWELGAANYYKWKDNGLTVLDVQQQWQTFKPASLAESKWKAKELSKETIDKTFPHEVSSMFKISSQTKTRRYRKLIESNPSDIDAHLQIGIVMAKMGDRKEAMKYFDKVIGLQPNNASALNNRGNLLMIDDQYVEAQKAYREATQANPEDAYIWINLAKSYKAVNDSQKAKEAFIKAQSLDPSVKQKYKALGLELLNTL